MFFDNGAGAQIPKIALDAVQDHLTHRSVQRGGRYRQSREVDEAIQRARESVAVFLNAREPEEIAFGMNATSFIRIVSVAIAETLGERREFVVSDLDHEANVATWMALEKCGAQIRWWRMREDGRLHVEDLAPVLNSRTRLVACTMASNALGSLVDVKSAAQMAHAAGAELFLDAVHYAPHGPLDVQEIDCDYLVCSGYKIFAPHMGFLYGKRAALDALPTFREDFIPDRVPMKIEVGTFVYENVAGMAAALKYLETLSDRISTSAAPPARRAKLTRVMEAIRHYEASLSSEMLRCLSEIEGVTIYGIRDEGMISLRVPTICFNVRGTDPGAVATHFGQHEIGIRDGNMYSPRLLARLGIPVTGAVRASLVHYNSAEEIERFVSVLKMLKPN